MLPINKVNRYYRLFSTSFNRGIFLNHRHSSSVRSKIQGLPNKLTPLISFSGVFFKPQAYHLL